MIKRKDRSSFSLSYFPVGRTYSPRNENKCWDGSCARTLNACALLYACKAEACWSHLLRFLLQSIEKASRCMV